VKLRDDVDAASKRLGRTLTFLVGKPGLDGHSNGAEQIAIRARDAGMNVIYDGIRFTPEQIVDAAREKKPHVIGLSILSGSHVTLAADVVRKLSDAGLSDVKVVAGGIIPPEDEERLKSAGVAMIFSPKDYDLCARSLRSPWRNSGIHAAECARSCRAVCQKAAPGPP
jgi:(2R)-ethylmalonyl-CoA mutase